MTIRIGDSVVQHFDAKKTRIKTQSEYTSMVNKQVTKFYQYLCKLSYGYVKCLDACISIDIDTTDPKFKNDIDTDT